MKLKLNYYILILFLTVSNAYTQTTINSTPGITEPKQLQNITSSLATTSNVKPSMDKMDINELQKRVLSLQNQLSDLNIYLSSLQVRLNDLIRGDNNKDMPLDKKQTEVKKLQEELMETDTKLKEAKTELDRISQEITDLENEKPNTEANPVQEKTDLADLKSKEKAQGINTSVEDLEKRIADLESKMKIMIGAQENSDNTLPNDMQSTQQEMEDSLSSEIDNGSIKVLSDNQAIKLQLEGDILFKEAEVSLSPEGEASLEKIAPLLKGLKDKVVMVIGHADPKPIGTNLKDFYPTNWELSTTRGTMVVRYLTEQLGVDPSLLMAAGRSFYDPQTEAGKERRTEIWIFPKLMEQDTE